MEADKDGDGKLSFEEFAQTVANTVRFFTLDSYRILTFPISGYCQANDTRRSVLK